MLIIYILNFILLRIIIPNSNWKHHDKLTDYGRKENPYILILLMAFFPIFCTRGPAFHHALSLTLSPSKNYPLSSPLPSFLPNALQVPLQHTLHPYLTGYCLPGMSLHFLKIWDLACHHSFSHSLFHHPPSTTTLAAIFWLNHPLPGLSATWVSHQQEAYLLPHQPTPPCSHSPFPTEILWSSKHPPFTCFLLYSVKLTCYMSFLLLPNKLPQ